MKIYIGNREIADESYKKTNDPEALSYMADDSECMAIALDNVLSKTDLDKIAKIISLAAKKLRTGGKLIIANTDTISGDTYITQYDYDTAVVELDLNIGVIVPTSMYQCDCNIFIVTADGTRYVIESVAPHTLVEVDSLTISPMSATQIATCVPNSITDSANITTTTSTSSTTTTTTTTP